MKTLTVYARTIAGYHAQYVVSYDGREYRNGHAEHVGNPRLRIPFRLVLKTRSKATIKRFLSKTGRTKADKWLSALLLDIMDR